MRNTICEWKRAVGNFKRQMKDSNHRMNIRNPLEFKLPERSYGNYEIEPEPTDITTSIPGFKNQKDFNRKPKTVQNIPLAKDHAKRLKYSRIYEDYHRYKFDLSDLVHKYNLTETEIKRCIQKKRT